MRDGTIKLLIAALLFVSMEGVAETVDEASFHQTHHAHADDGTEWFPDSDGGEHEGDACEHYCHVHFVALTMQASIPGLHKFQQYVPAPSPRSLTRATAPPTPPPNA